MGQAAVTGHARAVQQEIQATPSNKSGAVQIDIDSRDDTGKSHVSDVRSTEDSGLPDFDKESEINLEMSIHRQEVLSSNSQEDSEESDDKSRGKNLKEEIDENYPIGFEGLKDGEKIEFVNITPSISKSSAQREASRVDVVMSKVEPADINEEVDIDRFTREEMVALYRAIAMSTTQQHINSGPAMWVNVESQMSKCQPMDRTMQGTNVQHTIGRCQPLERTIHGTNMSESVENQDETLSTRETSTLSLPTVLVAYNVKSKMVPFDVKLQEKGDEKIVADATSSWSDKESSNYTTIGFRTPRTCNIFMPKKDPREEVRPSISSTHYVNPTKTTFVKSNHVTVSNCDVRSNSQLLQDSDQVLELKEVVSSDQQTSGLAISREETETPVQRVRRDLTVAELTEEMAYLKKRNEDLEEDVAARDRKIEKLADQNERIFRRFDEIEMDLVSKLMITDSHMATLSRVMNVAKSFETENKWLCEQVEKMREVVAEKNDQLYRYVEMSDGEKDGNHDALRQRLRKLEDEHALLRTTLDRNEEKCKEYEESVKGLEWTLKNAEDKLKAFVEELTCEACICKAHLLECKLKSTVNLIDAKEEDLHCNSIENRELEEKTNENGSAEVLCEFFTEEKKKHVAACSSRCQFSK